MKREIKFRGFRTDGKGWVYGDLLQCYYENKFYIFDFYGIESGNSLFNEVSVIPESIGQFTGLQDKNGVDIYEGDVLGQDFGKVVFSYGSFGIITEWGDLLPIYEINETYLEVIGNIYNEA